MNDNCHDLQSTPVSEAPVCPSEPVPAPTTSMFGPWMAVEKRQRRPQPKEATGRGTSSGVTTTESRFTQILDENINDPSSLARNAPTDAHLPVLSAVAFTHSITMKQTAATFHVRKPLQVNLVNFSILPRNGHKASSSKNPTLPKDDSRLDKNRHSSIHLTENSDPNIQNSGIDSSSVVNNLACELLKKPPDPIILVPTEASHAQENVLVDMQHDAHIVEVPRIVGDAHDSVMFE
ncbi:hypothetical protein V6N13_130589 [Hibiscus sabdariffa]